MAVFQVNHPAYIIYRDVAPGEPVDATSSLAFFPPKGSDELFDALREAFPQLKTHSERMRDAIIQFLLEERQGEQFELSPATTMESSQITWPSASSESASVFSSPDMPNFATPSSFTNSPQLRQASTATSSQPSPPSLDQMTGVFSLSSNPQPKQRVRRKMTESEKVEYRKRRIVKACDKCAKRKRKCPHNQAEMKSISTPSTKTSPQSTVSATPPTQQLDQGFPTFDESFDPTTFGSFGDFNMFDDPLPEFSVDEFFHLEQFQNSNTLFGDETHDPFVPLQQSRRYISPTHDAQAHSNVVSSRPTTLQESTAISSARRQASTSLQLPDILPEVPTQTYPSQRAVRDPRTDGSHSELNLSIDASERQSNRKKDVHRSDPSMPTLLPDYGMSPGIDSGDTCVSELSRVGSVPGRQLGPLGSSRSQELALASTSVSTLSGSPISRSATLQGRPQPRRLTNTATLPEQSPGMKEGGRRQPSLGEGISRTDSLASELFMLRRRLPASRRTETRENRDGSANVPAQVHPGDKNRRLQQSPEQLAAQANGGTYLQLESSDNPKTTHGNTTRVARRSNLSSKHGEHGGMHVAVTGQGLAPASSVRTIADSVYQDRLSDHVRYRDHHGRPQDVGFGLPQIVFMLGAIMALATWSPSISVCGLAVLFTVQSSASDDENSVGIVQCTAKNSSWLSDLERQNSPSVVGFKALKTRQYLRGGGSQAGVSLFEAGPEAWLHGLMYPFRLSPVLFAFA